MTETLAGPQNPELTGLSRWNLWARKDTQATLGNPLPINKSPGLYQVTEPIGASVEYVTTPFLPKVELMF